MLDDRPEKAITDTGCIVLLTTQAQETTLITSWDIISKGGKRQK